MWRTKVGHYPILHAQTATCVVCGWRSRSQAESSSYRRCFSRLHALIGNFRRCCGARMPSIVEMLLPPRYTCHSAVASRFPCNDFAHAASGACHCQSRRRRREGLAPSHRCLTTRLAATRPHSRQLAQWRSFDGVIVLEICRCGPVEKCSDPYLPKQIPRHLLQEHYRGGPAQCS